MKRLSLPLPETLDLSQEQEEFLCYQLELIEQSIGAIKKAVPELTSYNVEKVVGFLKEMKIIAKVNKALRENFKPVRGAYVPALDAVGNRSTAQIKAFAGDSSNNSRIIARPGSTIRSYIHDILLYSGKKKAYLVVHNRYAGKICATPAMNFVDARKTSLSWSEIIASSGSKIIRV